jgi:hypothetical protein
VRSTNVPWVDRAILERSAYGDRISGKQTRDWSYYDPRSWFAAALSGSEYCGRDILLLDAAKRCKFLHSVEESVDSVGRDESVTGFNAPVPYCLFRHGFPLVA